jgi:hypothetical protein
MELEFKPDFEKARQLWSAFWKGENTRPLVSIVLPKEGVKPVPHPPYLDGRDGNFKPIIDQLLAYAETHEFIGEAIPYFTLEWGPNTFSSYLGADLVFMSGTSWAVPFVEDWDDVKIRFRRDSYWWQLTVDMIHAIRSRCDGKLLINPPTLVANLDSLAAIRGNERLLIDLVECPYKIKRALDQVCRAHTEILETYAQLLDFDAYGSINVGGMYTKGRQSRPQCDMSCMISQRMFREFVVPCLKHEAADVDAMDYHLDGPGAIQHLGALCEIEELDTISWVPGSGEGQTQDWTSLHKKIDALGKGQTLWASHEDIKRLWKEYKSRKLFFYTTATSKSEAEDFLMELETIDKQGE